MANKSGVQIAGDLAHAAKALYDIIKAFVQGGWAAAALQTLKHYWPQILVIALVLLLLPIIIFCCLPMMLFGYMVTFTTKDQQMILDLLNLFGAVREDQAEAILKMKYPNATLERTINPLIIGKKIKKSNGYLFSRSGNLDEKIIEAIDIMLLLGPDITQPLQRTKEIFALTFYKNRENKLWRYDICPVAYGTEAVVSGMLEGENAKYRMFVFMPEKEEQMQGIRVHCEHCYVLKNNGKYEFYIYSKEGK